MILIRTEHSEKSVPACYSSHTDTGSICYAIADGTGGSGVAFAGTAVPMGIEVQSQATEVVTRSLLYLRHAERSW